MIETHRGYFLPKVEIKDFNVIIDGRNFFDQSIRNDRLTYDNIRNIATEWALGLSDCFSEISFAVDLSKSDKKMKTKRLQFVLLSTCHKEDIL